MNKIVRLKTGKIPHIVKYIKRIILHQILKFKAYLSTFLMLLSKNLSILQPK